MGGTWRRINNRIIALHCMFVKIMQVVRFLCRRETEKVAKNVKGKRKGKGNVLANGKGYVCREQKAQCPNKEYCDALVFDDNGVSFCLQSKLEYVKLLGGCGWLVALKGVLFVVCGV